MVFVSVTRLRIRRLGFMPAFVVHTIRSSAQLKRAEGFVGGSLLADRRRAFWTLTLWRDEADMRRYMTNGAHRVAMPKLMEWCDEASVAHWTQDVADPPTWQDADARMRTEGRPSKVRHPSLFHRELRYDAPRTAGAVPIRPRRPVIGQD